MLELQSIKMFSLSGMLRIGQKKFLFVMKLKIQSLEIMLLMT